MPPGARVALDVPITAAAISHILFGALYFGSDVAFEVGVMRGAAAATNVGELRAFQSILRRLVPLFGAGGMGALVTGLIFLAVKYGTLDPGTLWAIPRTRVILIALVVFLGLFVVAMAVLRPLSDKFLKWDLGTDPAAPVSEDMKAHLAKMGEFSHVQTAGIFIVIVLMIVAANGGF